MAYQRKAKPPAAALQSDPDLQLVYRWKLVNGEKASPDPVAFAKEHRPRLLSRMLGAIGQMKMKGSS